MEVIEIKHVEDCFDGSLIKELLLSQELNKDFIFALGKDGDIQYFSHFARPFFKIRVPDIYDLKGIEGNKTMRIHVKNPLKYSLDDFIQLLGKCK
jgi:hypothetical protein